MNGNPRFRRGLLQVVGFVALAALPVVALNSLATADTGSSPGSDAPRSVFRPSTDADLRCPSEPGLTHPAPPADGSRPAGAPRGTV